MKKVYSFLMAVVVLLSMFGLASTARAAGTLTYLESRFVWGKGVVFIFEDSGFKNKDLKGAVLFVESNDHKLSCWVNKDEGKVICVAGGGLTQYAGETGVITLAGRSFTVIIPGRSIPAESDSALTCPEGTLPGADVTFFTRDETLVTFFVYGSSISDVRNNAESLLGEFLLSIEDIGSLTCGEPPR